MSENKPDCISLLIHYANVLRATGEEVENVENRSNEFDIERTEYETGGMFYHDFKNIETKCEDETWTVTIKQNGKSPQEDLIRLLEALREKVDEENFEILDNLEEEVGYHTLTFKHKE